MSRDVDVSSANGEKPQSSVVPSCATGITPAASRMRPTMSPTLSTFGWIGSVTPTNRICPGFSTAFIAFNTRVRSFSLARQEYPDTSAYNDPEIVLRIDKKYHAGFVVKSPDPNRVQALLDSYSERFRRDFFATAPVPEKPTS